MYQRARQIAIDTTARLPFGLGDFIMQSEFARNVIKLSSGTGTVMAISFLITPINTRLFSPEDYGLANLILSISGIFSVLLSFNLNPVILMEKYRKVAEATATLSFILLGISLLVVAGLLFGFVDLILPLLKAESVKPWLPLAFIMMMIGGIGSIFTQLIQRQKLYGLISKAGIISNLVGHAIRLPWGYFAPSFYALYLSNTIAGIVNFTMWVPSARFPLVRDVKRLRCVFRKNLSFMTYQTIVAIQNTFSNQLPIFWIAAFCHTADVGYYGMAAMLIDVPCGLFLGSFQTVYYKRISDTVAHAPFELMNIYKRNTFKLILLGMIPLGGVALISPFLPWILGEHWMPVVLILQLFIFRRIIDFATVPVNAIITVLRKNAFFIMTGTLGIIVRGVSLILADHNLTSIMIYIIIGNFLFAWVPIIYVIKVIRNFEHSKQIQYSKV